MKRMLINATQEEELRMAMVDGQRLFDLNIEGPASERKKANIYKGKITRIEPSLEAAFVDYGADRHGFLPLKEISSEYFVNDVPSGKKPNIREVLKEGQDIVVQIDKEERGNKGAALTTYVSLAGRFIVLKPNKARSGGVSRRIVGDDRSSARDSLNEVEIPDGMSVILRTAGIDRSPDELAWDLETLLKVWQAILDHVLRKPAPFLLYRESNAVIRALRDYLSNEIGEILIDDKATYAEALEFIEQIMPHSAKKLKLYTDQVPLFTRFQIESQIESAFAHKVTLPSGGSIVIDHTEALVSIDINSARATKGGDIEATALNTNLEAAEEIARQLRIRDLGGLIVIDFIDMGPQKNQREVENRLRDSVKQDRARVQIGKISRFGLLEMSRQRLRPSIGESAYQTCPRCSGFGTIRSIESLALAILRLIGEEARKERTAKVIAQLPVDVATYLLNEKRDWVQSLEASNDTHVILVANSHLETPHYDIRRVRDDQAELPENAGASYSMAEVEPTPEVPPSIEERKAAEQAAIDVIKPSTPAPRQVIKEASSRGFWSWLTGLFAGGEDKPKKKKKESSDGSRRKKSSAPAKRGRGPKKSHKRGDGRQKDTRRKHSKKKPHKAAAQDDGDRQAQDDSARTQDAASQSGEDGRDTKKRPSRNRRSRGRRRRRRSGDGSQNETEATAREPRQSAGSEPKKNRAKQGAQEKEQPASQSQPAEAKKQEAPQPPAKQDASKQDTPKQDTPKQDTPKQDTPKQEASKQTTSKQDATQPAAGSAPPQKKAEDASPPRARTDSERAADAAKKEAQKSDGGNGNGAPKHTAKPEPKSEPDKAQPQPEKKLLPWDAPAASSDSKPAADSADRS